MNNQILKIQIIQFHPYNLEVADSTWKRSLVDSILKLLTVLYLEVADSIWRPSPVDSIYKWFTVHLYLEVADSLWKRWTVSTVEVVDSIWKLLTVSGSG